MMNKKEGQSIIVEICINSVYNACTFIAPVINTVIKPILCFIKYDITNVTIVCCALNIIAYVYGGHKLLSVCRCIVQMITCSHPNREIMAIHGESGHSLSVASMNILLNLYSVINWNFISKMNRNQSEQLN